MPGLVDVVPSMIDEVQVFPGHMPIGGEVAGLEMTAPTGRKPQTGRLIAGRWRGFGSAGGAYRRHRRGSGTSSFWLASRPLELDVDGVTEFGSGQDRAGSLDLFEGRIMRHFEPDFDGERRHATAGQGIRGEAGPEDDAVGGGIAGGDAELEGIAIETRSACPGRSGWRPGRGRRTRMSHRGRRRAAGCVWRAAFGLDDFGHLATFANLLG